MDWYEMGGHMSSGDGLAVVMVVLLIMQTLLLAGVLAVLLGHRAHRTEVTEQWREVDGRHQPDRPADVVAS